MGNCLNYWRLLAYFVESELGEFDEGFEGESDSCEGGSHKCRFPSNVCEARRTVERSKDRKQESSQK